MPSSVRNVCLRKRSAGLPGIPSPPQPPDGQRFTLKRVRFIPPGGRAFCNLSILPDGSSTRPTCRHRWYLGLNMWTRESTEVTRIRDLDSDVLQGSVVSLWRRRMPIALRIEFPPNSAGGFGMSRSCSYLHTIARPLSKRRDGGGILDDVENECRRPRSYSRIVYVSLAAVSALRGERRPSMARQLWV